MFDGFCAPSGQRVNPSPDPLPVPRWRLDEVLDMTYEEAVWWLEGANALEKEIFPDA